MSNANDDKSLLIDLLTCIATDRGYPGSCAPPGAGPESKLGRYWPKKVTVFTVHRLPR
jgi:hypothetical protein